MSEYNIHFSYYEDVKKTLAKLDWTQIYRDFLLWFCRTDWPKLLRDAGFHQKKLFPQKKLKGAEYYKVNEKNTMSKWIIRYNSLPICENWKHNKLI